MLAHFLPFLIIILSTYWLFYLLLIGLKSIIGHLCATEHNFQPFTHVSGQKDV